MASVLSAYEAAFVTDNHAVMLSMMRDDVVFRDPVAPADITSRAALKEVRAFSTNRVWCPASSSTASLSLVSSQ